MGAQVEAYIYGSGAVGYANSGATLTISGTDYTAGVDGVLSFTVMLAALAAQLSALSGATVGLAYNATTDRVTLTCSSAAAVDWIGNTGKMLGFEQQAYLAATSLTAEQGPGALVPLQAAIIDPARVIDRAEMVRYRHGQALTTTWAGMRVQQVELVARAPYADRLTAWVASGLITVTDAEGYTVTGWVADETDLSTQGQREQYVIRRLQLVPVDDVGNLPLAQYAGLWGALAFGWSTVYALTVDGIPTVFVERAQNLDIPDLDASLSIDDSADVGVEIDRQKGIGAGLALSAVLRDTATVRGYMRRPSLFARLTDTYYSGSPFPIEVDDTSAWASSGAFYLGHERFTYTGKTGTTFTGVSRDATYSGLRRVYEPAQGYTVTDRPLSWRGRRCLLRAYPVDPSGYVDDTAPVAVWYGEVEAEPLRRRDGFQLQAQPIDRVLDRDIAGSATGVVEDVQGVVAYPNLFLRLSIQGAHSHGSSAFAYNDLVIEPFADLTTATLLTWGDFASRLRQAWYDVFSSIIGNIYVDEYPHIELLGNGGLSLRAGLLYDNNFHVYRFSAYWQGSFLPPTGFIPWRNMPASYGTVQSSQSDVICWWGNGDARVMRTPLDKFEPKFYPCALVRLDTPTLETYDTAQFVLGTLTCDVVCDSVVADDGRVFLYNIANKNGGQLTFSIAGTTVRLGNTLANVNASPTTKLAEVCYAMLVSTGSGNNSVYDVLPASTGYAIPQGYVTWDGGGLGEGEAGTLDTLNDEAIAKLAVLPDRVSLVGLVGGLLTLRRQAIALVPFGNGLRLQIVSTAPGASDYGATLTDSDLLGYAEEPAETVERLRPPNRLTIEAAEGSDPVTVQDLAAIGIEGLEEWKLTIPVDDRDSQVALALTYGPSLLQLDRSAQAARVMLPPWTAVQLGGSVKLTTSHPGLWSSATGQPGYDSTARVTGLTRNLRDGRQTATLLLDGAVTQRALCPSVQVYDWTGDPDDPVIIRVQMPRADGANLSYALLDYIDRMLTNSGGLASLLHYQPGVTEGAGEYIRINAAAYTDGVGEPPLVELTVQSVSGLTALTADSWLTLPDLDSAEGSTWQNEHAHTDDGSYWEG